MLKKSEEKRNNRSSTIEDLPLLVRMLIFKTEIIHIAVRWKLAYFTHNKDIHLRSENVSKWTLVSPYVDLAEIKLEYSIIMEV